MLEVVYEAPQVYMRFYAWGEVTSIVYVVIQCDDTTTVDCTCVRTSRVCVLASVAFFSRQLSSRTGTECVVEVCSPIPYLSVKIVVAKRGHARPHANTQCSNASAINSTKD